MSSLESAKVLIIGLGLIGGSIARGLKQNNPNQALVACDSDCAQLEAALSAGDIDAAYEWLMFNSRVLRLILWLLPCRRSLLLPFFRV